MVKILNPKLIKYKGNVQPTRGECYPKDGSLIYPYLPSEELVEAVNLAIYLGRPLLLKGEPGCGKTQLARAVAYELKLDYKVWSIKSTSRARDGLYSYDAVSRLRDAQLAAAARIAEDIDPAKYIKWGPLGEAFRNDKRTVVLIDEIDKADIDFPNDLLLELDECRFFVEEMDNQEIRAKEPPIIFITSNDEKDLPDAFLRRCLFHYVEFPKHEALTKIIEDRFPEASQELVNKAITRFAKLRKKMQENQGNVKKVSTSELIDWFTILQEHETDEILKELEGTLPFCSILLKSWGDHRQYLGKKD